LQWGLGHAEELRDIVRSTNAMVDRARADILNQVQFLVDLRLKTIVSLFAAAALCQVPRGRVLNRDKLLDLLTREGTPVPDSVLRHPLIWLVLDMAEFTDDERSRFRQLLLKRGIQRDIREQDWIVAARPFAAPLLTLSCRRMRDSIRTCKESGRDLLKLRRRRNWCFELPSPLLSKAANSYESNWQFVAFPSHWSPRSDHAPLVDLVDSFFGFQARETDGRCVVHVGVERQPEVQSIGTPEAVYAPAQPLSKVSARDWGGI
jgi:hypothetical protein